MDLFSNKLKDNLKDSAPLAERMRPLVFTDFIGQKHICSKNSILRNAVENDQMPSCIFWGPPGVGKTTLAKIIAQTTKSSFVPISAVASGVKDLRVIIQQAIDNRKFYNKKTIVFVDEIHRWNKLQQDALLPYVEKGIITLIGATTENPSFEVNNALLSRCRVFVMYDLKSEDIEKVIINAIKDRVNGLGKYDIEIEKILIEYLAVLANGDARAALNALELATKSSKQINGKIVLNKKCIQDSIQRTLGKERYDQISALHKSIRGSDIQASLYWLGRLLESGEDPLYISRRLIRCASEDIGLSDNNALNISVSTYQACHAIGMPECNVILSHCVIYLAKAKKSNKAYIAYMKVQESVIKTETEPVPLNVRNAPTSLMKDLGYGKGYMYNPDYKEDIKQNYLPDSIKDIVFYEED